MRAVVVDAFGEPPRVAEVPRPVPAPHGAVVAVAATGVCRSDWHAWQGHDPDVRLPHVPGHELAGTVAEVGPAVTRWRVGDRVSVPFVCGCGACPTCLAGQHQVCERQTQPGFTHWGSFAEAVAIDHADLNLVRIPEEVGWSAAAVLGCRFGTALRAVRDQGGVRGGEWVAVHGCGGLGLAAVQVAVALGALVVAVDVSSAALARARELGAVATLDASGPVDAGAGVRDLTRGGAHVSLDCAGHPQACAASVRSLRRQGRHVQVGLLPPAHGVPAVPMDRVIAYELRILGSHGLSAREYPGLLRMVAAGVVRPDRLVGPHIGLADVGPALADMGTEAGRSGAREATPGITMVDLTRG